MVNPSRPRKKRAGKKKRKLSPKQVRIFGTKAQKAALRRKRRPVSAKSNPAPRRKKATRKRKAARVRVRTVTKIVYRTKKTKRRKRNPANIVALGLVNPSKGTRKVKRTPKRSTRKSHRNPTRVVVRTRRRRISAKGRRRSNPSRRRHSSRRNPQLFGKSLNAGEMLKQVLGGLAGVTIARIVPAALPLGGISSNPIGRAVLSAASGYAAGMLARSFAPDLEGAVMFGGFMYAGATLINSFMPGIGVSLGDFVPSANLLPYNGIRSASAAKIAAQTAIANASSKAPGGSRMTMSGINRGFGRGAF